MSDFIFMTRFKLDPEFQDAFNDYGETEPRLPTIEIESLDQIYDLRNFQCWNYLVDTPYESLLDVDDPDNGEALVIIRYYEHTAKNSFYIEFDQRILTEPNQIQNFN